MIQTEAIVDGARFKMKLKSVAKEHKHKKHYENIPQSYEYSKILQAL